MSTTIDQLFGLIQVSWSIKIQWSDVRIYKTNAQPNEIETRLRVTKPFKIASQRIKYSHTNLLTYQAQQLHRNTSISYPCQPLHYHQMNYKNVYKLLLIVFNKKNKLQQKKELKNNNQITKYIKKTTNKFYIFFLFRLFQSLLLNFIYQSESLLS